MSELPNRKPELPTFHRFFSVEEARSCLPAVVRTLEQVRDLRARIAAAAADLEQIEPIQRNNGAGQLAVRLEREIDEGIVALDRSFRSLRDEGIELKDADQGIIDFPHIREGRVVFLCYRLGEPDIAFWHELDGGFAGRQPL